MSSITIKAGLLGLVATVLIGSFSAVPAFAEGGPYCWHREAGSKGAGEKLTQGFEQLKGYAQEQKIGAKIGGSEANLIAGSVQVKGVLYNNGDQCQAKLELVYHELKGPGTCTFTINGPNNIVKLYAHAAWTYAGKESELTVKPQFPTQSPNWIFTPIELQLGAKELPKGILEVWRFSGTGCLISGFELRVEGSMGSSPIVQGKPAEIGVFSPVEEQKVEKGEAWQHFWNGREFVPVKTGLVLAGAGASYNGNFVIGTALKQQKPEQQEIDFREE